MLKKMLGTLAIALTLLAATGTAKPKQAFMIHVLTTHADGQE